MDEQWLFFRRNVGEGSYLRLWQRHRNIRCAAAAAPYALERSTALRGHARWGVLFPAELARFAMARGPEDVSVRRTNTSFIRPPIGNRASGLTAAISGCRMWFRQTFCGVIGGADQAEIP